MKADNFFSFRGDSRARGTVLMKLCISKDSRAQIFQGIALLIGGVILVGFLLLMVIGYGTKDSYKEGTARLEIEEVVGISEGNPSAGGKYEPSFFLFTMKSLSRDPVNGKDFRVRIYRNSVVEKEFSLTDSDEGLFDFFVEKDGDKSIISKGEIFSFKLDVSGISFSYRDNVEIQFLEENGKIGELVLLAGVKFIMPETVNRYEKLA